MKYDIFCRKMGKNIPVFVGRWDEKQQIVQSFFVTVHYAKPKARLGLGLTGVGRWEGTKNNDGN